MVKPNSDRAISRRAFGTSALALSGTMVAAATPLRFALGAEPLKIGLILPYSGVYANFGEGITNGFEFALKKRGGQLGGRPVADHQGRRSARSEGRQRGDAEDRHASTRSTWWSARSARMWCR